MNIFSFSHPDYCVHPVNPDYPDHPGHPDHVNKFQNSVKNLNNLWSFIEIYVAHRYATFLCSWDVEI